MTPVARITLGGKGDRRTHTRFREQFAVRLEFDQLRHCRAHLDHLLAVVC